MREPEKKFRVDGQEYSVFNSDAEYNLQKYGCEYVTLHCVVRLKANATYRGTIIALCETCENPYMQIEIKHAWGQEDIAIFKIELLKFENIIENTFKVAGLKIHSQAVEKQVKILTDDSGELDSLIILKGGDAQ